MNNSIIKAKNTWTNGLVMDFAPDNTLADVLTSALNATLLTFNGNEMSLQNDMGNARVETASLPEGYIPVGTCEFGGIIYIVSYNPLTNLSQIGCFPSPERNIRSDETIDLVKSISIEDFLEINGQEPTGNIKTSQVKKILTDKSVNPGDKFIIYTKQDISKKSHITKDFSNPDWLTIHVVSISEDGKITYLDSTLQKYNDFYFPNFDSNKNNEENINSYRTALTSGYNVFQSKTSGKLALLIELEKPESFEITYTVNLNEEKNFDIDLEYKLNSENINLELIGLEVDSDSLDIFEKTKNENGEEVINYEKILNQSDVIEFDVTPCVGYGKLEEFKQTVKIDLSKYGKGTHEITRWKYYNTEIDSVLLFGINLNPKPNTSIKPIQLKFKEVFEGSKTFIYDTNKTSSGNYIFNFNLADKEQQSEESQQSGETLINLKRDTLYKVAISETDTEEEIGERWFWTNTLMNLFYTTENDYNEIEVVEIEPNIEVSYSFNEDVKWSSIFSNKLEKIENREIYSTIENISGEQPLFKINITNSLPIKGLSLSDDIETKIYIPKESVNKEISPYQYLHAGTIVKSDPDLTGETEASIKFSDTSSNLTENSFVYVDYNGEKQEKYCYYTTTKEEEVKLNFSGSYTSKYSKDYVNKFVKLPVVEPLILRESDLKKYGLSTTQNDEKNYNEHIIFNNVYSGNGVWDVDNWNSLFTYRKHDVDKITGEISPKEEGTITISEKNSSGEGKNFSIYPISEDWARNQIHLLIPNEMDGQLGLFLITEQNGEHVNWTKFSSNKYDNNTKLISSLQYSNENSLELNNKNTWISKVNGDTIITGDTNFTKSEYLYFVDKDYSFIYEGNNIGDDSQIQPINTELLPSPDTHLTLKQGYYTYELLVSKSKYNNNLNIFLVTKNDSNCAIIVNSNWKLDVTISNFNKKISYSKESEKFVVGDDKYLYKLLLSDDYYVKDTDLYYTTEGNNTYYYKEENWYVGNGSSDFKESGGSAMFAILCIKDENGNLNMLNNVFELYYNKSNGQYKLTQNLKTRLNPAKSSYGKGDLYAGDIVASILKNLYSYKKDTLQDISVSEVSDIVYLSDHYCNYIFDIIFELGSKEELEEYAKLGTIVLNGVNYPKILIKKSLKNYPFIVRFPYRKPDTYIYNTNLYTGAVKIGDVYKGIVENLNEESLYVMDNGTIKYADSLKDLPIILSVNTKGEIFEYEEDLKLKLNHSNFGRLFKIQNNRSDSVVVSREPFTTVYKRYMFGKKYDGLDRVFLYGINANLCLFEDNNITIE